MVRANHSIARIEQSLDDGAEIGHALAAVAEPGAAIDMDYDGIAFLFLFGKIDVTGMKSLIVASIIHILPLLGCFQFHLRYLESSEATCRLCHRERTQAQQNR